MTAPISVDPSALAAAGESVGAEGDEITAVVSALETGLAGAGAMFGHDAAAVVFAQGYAASGKSILDAAASGVNACRRVGFGIEKSAANYDHANASSTVGGGGAPLPKPDVAAPFSAPSVPPPFGDGIAAPIGWALVEGFVGDVWPDGNPAELRAAATAWRSFGTAMTGLAGQVKAKGRGLSAQQIPEARQMGDAVGGISSGLDGLALQTNQLASNVDGFASAVETTQNAVRSLLDQLSLSGVMETIGGTFTGHNPIDKVREVAHEIKVVLDNMKREADATSKIFTQGINMLDSATDSLEKWAKKEFTDALGQDVGGVASFGFNALVDQPEGALKFVAETVQGVQQLDPTRFAYDPSGAAKTWEGLLESAAVVTNPTLLAQTVLSDPQGSLDTVKDVVDWKDVEAGHPFRAVGYDGAQVASALIPGVGEAEPAIEGASVAGRAASAEERAAAGAAREGIPGLTAGASASDNVATQAARVGEDLDGIKVPESTTPGAAPGASAPTGRPPVDVPAPADAPGGRAPVERAPATPDASRPEATTSGSAGSDASEPARPVPASDSASPVSPDAAEAAPPQADPSPSPPSHRLETAQIAESSEQRDLAETQHTNGPQSTPSVSEPVPAVEQPAPRSLLDDPKGGPHPSADDGDLNHATDHIGSNGESRGDTAHEGAPPGLHNPPHTGLYDPPANQGLLSQQLPDLSTINNEYRLPDGSIELSRLGEWAYDVSEAYPLISPDGAEGVYNYTTESYQGMNPYLRDVDPLSPSQQFILGADSIDEMTQIHREYWEAQISSADDGLSSLPPYRADVMDPASTTWRGMQASDSLLSNLNIGDVFRDPAYFSTTTDAKLGELFARAGGPDTTPTLFTVIGQDGVDVAPLSRYSDEGEILFPRSSMFEVVFREMGADGLMRITLRQVVP